MIFINLTLVFFFWLFFPPQNENFFQFNDFHMHSEYLFARKNGFSLEEDPHAPAGLRFRLKAVPFSKKITFGVEGSLCYHFLFPVF